MQVNNVKNKISFGWTLKPEEAILIKGLPKEHWDTFEKQLMEAPMDATKEASDVRDNILREAIKLAKKLKGLL